MYKDTAGQSVSSAAVGISDGVGPDNAEPPYWIVGGYLVIGIWSTQIRVGQHAGERERSLSRSLQIGISERSSESAYRLRQPGLKQIFLILASTVNVIPDARGIDSQLLWRY
jgi:hypothetical protein